jgi:hypothetical protein
VPLPRVAPTVLTEGSMPGEPMLPYSAFLWKRLKSPRPFVHADDPAAP